MTTKRLGCGWQIGFFCLSSLWTLSGTSRGGALPESLEIGDSMRNADAVVLVTLSKFTALDPANSWDFSGTDPRAILNEEIRPRGAYDFHIEATIIGDLKGELSVELPRLANFYYDEAKLPVEKNGTFLLFLKRDKAGRWTPVDPTLPLLPISAKSIANANKLGKNAEYIGILLDSLEDPVSRRVILYRLCGTMDKRIANEAFKFIDDKEPEIRDSALLCMATNQDVRAIQKIIQMEDDTEKKMGSGVRCVRGLSLYHAPDAIPLLNPAIVGHSEYVRINAMFSLARIADKTSIPFLISAMEDDDSQHIMPYSAYETLHRMVPALGPPKGEQEFLAHSDEEIQLLKQWWDWQKRKPTAATKPATMKPANP